MEKEPWQWDVNDIQRMIDENVKESSYLDYKSSGALTKDGAKADISKDVSSFANAGGGVIIYGVREENNIPIEIDEGFDPSKVTREWLEQVIISSIHRNIEGIRINQVCINKDKGNRVLYVVQIPESERAPHQAVDKRFYTRRNFISEPMEEYEVRDVFNRKRAPNVMLDLFLRRAGARIDRFQLCLKNPETIHGLEINGALTNEGGGEVHYAIISLIFDGRLNPGSKNQKIQFQKLKYTMNEKEIDVFKTNINWGGPSKMPLFKTADFLLSNKEINIHFLHPWLQEEDAPFIHWEVRAAGMIPNKGFYRVRLDGDEVLLSPEEMPEITKITQDDRNRYFLENPDLSFDPDII